MTKTKFRKLYAIQQEDENQIILAEFTDNEYAAVEIALSDRNQISPSYIYITEISPDLVTPKPNDILPAMLLFYHGVQFYWNSYEDYQHYLALRPTKETFK